MTGRVVALREALEASPIVRATELSAEGSGLLALGQERHWKFRLLGKRPPLTRPTFRQQWWLVPVEEESGAIPPRALKRVRAIYQAGLRPQAFVIAHEAPPLLQSPQKRREGSNRQVSTPSSGEVLTPIVAICGALLRGLGLLLAMAVPALGALLGMALMAAIAVDPRLIAITSEGEWIEIDRWQA